MARLKKPAVFGQNRKDGPGLTLLSVGLVVVAVVGAKFLGFSPGSKPPEPQAPAPPQVQQAPTVVGQQALVIVTAAHPTENYSPASPHATGTGDVVSVAHALCEKLRGGNLTAQFVADGQNPSWQEAFDVARAAVLPVLSAHQNVAAIVDVHRDALEHRPDGYTTVNVNGRPVAKIMLLVGDLENPYYEQNLAFAEELRRELEALAPGITRGIKTMHQSFNGDLHPRSVQVHIGEYYDNNLNEAMAAVEILAQGLRQVLE